jgi:hypothetical protein
LAPSLRAEELEPAATVLDRQRYFSLPHATSSSASRVGGQRGASVGGLPPGMIPTSNGPFPTAPPRTGLAHFLCIRLSGGLGLARVGSWHHTYLHGYFPDPPSSLRPVDGFPVR